MPNKNDILLETENEGQDNNYPTGKISWRMQTSAEAAMKFSNFAIISTVSFAAAEWLSAPYVIKASLQPIFAAGYIYLTGINYGIVNDIIGCHRSLPYFSLGHQPSQTSIVESNKPAVVGIAWGFLATDMLAKIGGAAYAFVSLSSSMHGKVIPFTVLSKISLATSLSLAGAIVFSRTLKVFDKAKDFDEMVQSGQALNYYQAPILKHWLKSEADKKNWLANSNQNLFGYLSMTIIIVAHLLKFYDDSCDDKNEKMNSNLPIMIGIAMCLSVGLARSYYHANRDTQTSSNPYRLNFLSKPKVKYAKLDDIQMDDVDIDNIQRSLTQLANKR